MKTIPRSLLKKTCWIYTKSDAKWHNGDVIESGKVLGRVTAINDNTLTIRNDFNIPRIVRLDDVERVVKTNRDFHITYMQNVLENVLCC